MYVRFYNNFDVLHFYKTKKCPYSTSLGPGRSTVSLFVEIFERTPHTLVWRLITLDFFCSTLKWHQNIIFYCCIHSTSIYLAANNSPSNVPHYCTGNKINMMYSSRIILYSCPCLIMYDMYRLHYRFRSYPWLKIIYLSIRVY